MKIIVVGSIKFFPEYKKMKNSLEKVGHKVIIPKPNKFYHGEANIKRKTMDEFNEDLAKSDAVLVANLEKDREKDYIGVNSIMEIGMAFNRNKKIFILNKIPDNCREELKAIKAIELNGNLDNLR